MKKNYLFIFESILGILIFTILYGIFYYLNLEKIYLIWFVPCWALICVLCSYIKNKLSKEKR